MVKPVVRIDDLRLEFLSQAGPFEALKGISLDINEGEIVGVVGESGSGKSVTAMNLLQLLPRTKINVPTGSISVLDNDVQSMSETELQAIRGGEISMIFQEPMTALNPVLRIKNQIDDVICAIGMSPPKKRSRCLSSFSPTPKLLTPSACMSRFRTNYPAACVSAL